MVRNWKNVLPLWPSKTGAEVRFVKRGCSNRNYFELAVCPKARRLDLAPNEVIGVYDPMDNEKGEKLVSLDVDRFAYWLGQGALMTPEVSDLLGLCGLMPLTPEVLLTARQQRRQHMDTNQGKSDTNQDKKQ